MTAKRKKPAPVLWVVEMKMEHGWIPTAGASPSLGYARALLKAWQHGSRHKHRLRKYGREDAR